MTMLSQPCCVMPQSLRMHWQPLIPPVSWQNVRLATKSDKEMQDIMTSIKSGFPSISRLLPTHVKPYLTYKSSLYVLDDMVMLSEHIIVPRHLCPVLNLLLAALGVDRMKRRSAESVYWHNFVGDIATPGLPQDVKV